MKGGLCTRASGSLWSRPLNDGDATAECLRLRRKWLWLTESHALDLLSLARYPAIFLLRTKKHSEHHGVSCWRRCRRQACAALPAKGYSLSRPGRTAQYLGPCVASSEEEARPLIAAHLEGAHRTGDVPSKWYWDLLPMNEAAVRCATEFGFTRRRTFWRMRRGESIRTNDAMVYAIAGFELG